MTDHLPGALLLDLDGTLVDSEPIHRAAYQAFFAQRGWDVADLTPFTGRRAQDVFASVPGPWSEADPEELAAAVVACIPSEAAPEPVAGARALIEAAAAHDVRVAVVTSAAPPWAERALFEVLGVGDHVDVVVTAHDVVDGKPDPTGFALACERLHVAPEDCVAVEDSPAGVAAAVAAGVVKVYGLASTHAPGDLLEAGAAAVYDDLGELAAEVSLTF
jgi:mannitol-1-/sugar-/sorbitol-6-phosphatase